MLLCHVIFFLVKHTHFFVSGTYTDSLMHSCTDIFSREFLKALRKPRRRSRRRRRGRESEGERGEGGRRGGKRGNGDRKEGDFTVNLCAIYEP